MSLDDNLEQEINSGSLADNLITVRDCMRWAMSRFCESELYYGHGTTSAWDEAAHLVLQSVFLPLDIDDRVLDARLTYSERNKIIRWVYRRVVERIPLAYLTHNAWFADLKFYVDERVIVPRSPFGELIRTEFEPWVEQSKVKKILDLCTGSGCIGIGCAYVFPDTEVTLSDISEDALEVAKRNIRDHKLTDRVRTIESDLFNNLPGGHYDLIVTNPPYVDEEDLSTMPLEYKKEPEIALASGKDGLDIIRRILREAPHHLNATGTLIVEVGNSQHALVDAFANVPFTWLSFKDGGDGVFLLTAEELLQYHEEFLAQ